MLGFRLQSRGMASLTEGGIDGLVEWLPHTIYTHINIVVVDPATESSDDVAVLLGDGGSESK